MTLCPATDRAGRDADDPGGFSSILGWQRYGLCSVLNDHGATVVDIFPRVVD